MPTEIQDPLTALLAHASHQRICARQTRHQDFCHTGYWQLHNSGPAAWYQVFTFNAHRLLQPVLFTGIKTADIRNKTFRALARLPVQHLPLTYPRASKTAWKLFSQVSFPHHAHIILWRAFHFKLPTCARLQSYNLPFASDGLCPLCH